MGIDRFSSLFVAVRWTLIGLVAWPALAVAVWVVAFGMDAVVVEGQSMHPALRRGDVVLVNPAREPLELGEVILFDTGAGRTIHRIVASDVDGWRTRGDANPAEDSDIVTAGDLQGVGVIVLPYAGWIRTQSVAAVVVVVAGMLGALHVIRSSRANAATASLVVVLLIGVVGLPESRAAFRADTSSGGGNVTFADPADPSAAASAGCDLIVLDPFVDVTWSVPSSLWIDAFDVQRATAVSGPYTSVGIVDPSVDEFRDTTVAQLSRYWYRVVSRAGPWDSAPSEAISADTGLCVRT